MLSNYFIPRHMPATMHCLYRVLEKRDEVTHDHAARVGHLTSKLALQMGLAAKQAKTIGQAALMHDIGKLVVPLEIIQKPSELTPEEWAIIKTHSAHGYAILSGTDDPELDLAADIALSHHEHFDGTGYPHGIKGEDISLPARITMICDIYDALRQDRPYRHAMHHDVAMNIIVNGGGATSPSHFDPRALSALQRIAGEIRHLYDAPPPRMAKASA